MKRIISLILAVAMVFTFAVTALSGCSISGGGKGSDDFVMPAGGFDTETPVTITFYHSMGAALQDILEFAISDFQALYPNVTVEHQYIGNYDAVRDQIKSEITVGGQPNLAYCYPDHVALYNISGSVQTLDVFIEDETYGFTEEQLDDFIEGFYNEGKTFGDGKMYLLPLSKSTEVLYYNKTFFEENNLTVPTTWEEMEAVCRQIKAIKPNDIPLGYDSEANWFITMCEQIGSGYTSAEGENFLFDNAQNKEFVKEFRSWFDEGLVFTPALMGAKYSSDRFTGAEKDGTRCYMSIGSTGGTTYQMPEQQNGKFEFEVGIAPIPQVNPAEPKVISQGPSICIFKDDNPQEVLATWLFAKFLTTDVTFQASVSMNNGYTPVIKSVEDNPTYAEFLGKSGTANLTAYGVKVALEQANNYYTSPAFNGSSVARDQVGLLLQKCLGEETDDLDAMIDKAFADAVAKCKYEAGQ